MSVTQDLLEGLAQDLDAAGIARYTDLFAAGDTGVGFKVMPAEPDRFVLLTAYGPAGDNAGYSIGSLSVQVKVRGLAGVPFDEDALADAIFARWHAMEDRTFGSVHLIQMLRRSGTPLGVDESGRRPLRVDNYGLDLDYPPTPNRPI